jgi:hypothetical protein
MAGSRNPAILLVVDDLDETNLDQIPRNHLHLILAFAGFGGPNLRHGEGGSTKRDRAGGEGLDVD